MGQNNLGGENVGEIDINNKKKTSTKDLEALPVEKITVDPGEAGAANSIIFGSRNWNSTWQD